MSFTNYELWRDFAMDYCIRIVSDDIDSIRLKYPEDSWRSLLWAKLKDKCSLMRIFYSCGKKWGNGVECASALCSLEQNILKHSLEIQFVYLTFSEAFDDWVAFENDNYDFFRWVTCFIHQQEEAIMEETEALHQILSCGILDTTSSTSQTEMEELLGIIDSILLLEFYNVCRTDDLKESLRFLKNFILFVASRGLVPKHMGDLLIHAGGVVVDVACVIFTTFIALYIESPGWSNLYKLIDRIEPFESRVCEMYVGVLQQASEVSESSNYMAPGCQTLMLADFVDSLLFLLFHLLFRCTDHLHIFDRQIYKLYKGLKFLRTTLREVYDKVDELYDQEMHDLIGSLICEAGVVVCYLFVGKKERSLGEKLDLLISKFDEKLKFVNSEEDEEGEAPRCQLSATFPHTNLLGFIDSILEKMNPVNQHEAHLVVASVKNKLQIVHDDLAFLRSFLLSIKGKHDEDGKLYDLWKRVAKVAYETEFVLDFLVVGGVHQSFIVLLHTIIAEIELIKKEASGSSHSIRQIIKVHTIAITDSKKPFAGKIPDFDEDIVGLDDESEKIVWRLKRGTKNLDIVPIVGMAGLGKTTLAKKVYRDPSITFHFQAHLWCTVSQVWNRKSLLIAILNSLGQKSVEELSRTSEDDLGDALRKYLKGKIYLVILDDVWDTEVWSCLKNSFPDDSKGSRILITSRSENVALGIRTNSKPLHLRLLTFDESWELFQKKMCFVEGCPPELLARGKAIATRCKGLPLMILVVAGVLSNMEPGIWEEIEESLKKGNLPTTEECQEIIELSYNNLPDHLKPCFLYLGAYKEDEKVLVRELLWLWKAEGFVNKTERVCEEDVAYGYMMELIHRNLIMVAETGSRGRVKYCVLHDVLLDFCKTKGKHEHFLHSLHGHELGIYSQPSMLYRLHVNHESIVDFAESRLLFPYLRTLLFNDNCGMSHASKWYDILYNFCQSKLLRVLGLNGIFEFSFFPSAIQLLVHLRYLTLTSVGEILKIPSSIACLSNLETFIVLKGFEVLLPDTLWNMKKLRHMKASCLLWKLPTGNSEHLSSLENLQTLSCVSYSHDQTWKEVIRKLPNIRRLKCGLSLVEEQDGALKIFALDFLSQLESLHITQWGDKCVDQFQLPQSLKKLTLSQLNLPWSEISVIDKLPNLEVLKLLDGSFTGETWSVEEVTFPKLRFLKLEGLDLVSWTIDSEDSFPFLEILVLNYCELLEELPVCLAESSTLQMIEVCGCDTAADSINQIQEMKTEFGNEDLKILIE
ncbi:OLC1v1005936C2 [Oldenlandia corymbosa var. corymbosa]|uniref:OLC1v1005936C2 n=1 Tax=Oldenlandia corymbosa var. corymbosa TaxID=529605 RepID=A0AAV1DFP9_OLDCO|nr:OLC1v1005936C2 [Oldenlandia corymbosa var. corymbosa]